MRKVLFLSLLLLGAFVPRESAACTKCKFQLGGYTCIASTFSCCIVLDPSTCSFGPCIGGECSGRLATAALPAATSCSDAVAGLTAGEDAESALQLREPDPASRVTVIEMLPPRI